MEPRRKELYIRLKVVKENDVPCAIRCLRRQNLPQRRSISRHADDAAGGRVPVRSNEKPISVGALGHVQAAVIRGSKPAQVLH